MAIAGLASATYGIGKAVGFKPGKFVGNIFGGRSDCSQAKKQEAQQIAEDLHKWTNRRERVDFIKSTGSSLSRIPASPEKMAHFYIGEDDCKHKNVSGRHKKFINGLKPFINRMKRQKQSQVQPRQSRPQAGSQAGSQAGPGGVAKYLRWAFFAGVGYMLFYLVTQK